MDELSEYFSRYFVRQSESERLAAALSRNEPPSFQGVLQLLSMLQIRLPHRHILNLRKAVLGDHGKVHLEDLVEMLLSLNIRRRGEALFAPSRVTILHSRSLSFLPRVTMLSQKQAGDNFDEMPQPRPRPRPKVSGGNFEMRRPQSVPSLVIPEYSGFKEAAQEGDCFAELQCDEISFETPEYIAQASLHSSSKRFRKKRQVRKRQTQIHSLIDQFPKTTFVKDVAREYHVFARANPGPKIRRRPRNGHKKASPYEFRFQIVGKSPSSEN